MKFGELLTIMECKDYMYVKNDILCHSASPLPIKESNNEPWRFSKT